MEEGQASLHKISKVKIHFNGSTWISSNVFYNTLSCALKKVNNTHSLEHAGRI